MFPTPVTHRSVLMLTLFASGACAVRVATRAGDVSSATGPGVEAARELDQEGVRAYKAGRFTDAVAYFHAALRLGGPPSELWNIVRCREGMDDAEGAAAAIDDYLMSKDLPRSDRADAEREAQALRSRPSILTVTTSPPGALVLVDGKPASATPASVEITAGRHSLAVRRAGYASASATVEARFGRAVIVSIDLERSVK